MKNKEIKIFAKSFSKVCENEKWEMLTNLFHSWTKDFEKFNKNSGHEIIGFVQRKNIIWKELCGFLSPIREDCYVTDVAWVQFFFQNVRYIADDLYPRASLESLLKTTGFSYDKVFVNSGEHMDFVDIERDSPRRVIKATFVKSNLLKGKF